MSDAGHEETEKLLADVEMKILREYQEAEKVVKDRLKEFLQEDKQEMQEMKAKLKAGEITKATYKQWRVTQVMTKKHWQDMRKVIATDLHNANVIARSVVQSHMPDAYAINMNYGMFMIERGANIKSNFELYDRQTVENLLREDKSLIPGYGKKLSEKKDISYQERKLQSITLQSILTGESIPRISGRIAKEMSITNERITMKYARTAMTGAQNAGREDSYKRAQAMGIKLKKMWVATLDNRTRHEHRQLDGQTVDIDKPFKVDGEEIRYPGDATAPAYLVWNCRCTTISQIEGFERDAKALELRDTSHMKKNQTYEQWKIARAGAKANDPYSEERKNSALNFSTKEKADEYLRPRLDEMWHKLTDTEKYGIWKYTENSNPMNKVLSGYEGSWSRDNFKGVGNTNWNYEDAWRQNPEEFRKFGHENGTIDHARSIAAATRAIDKTNLDKDMFLYRGSDSNGLAGMIEGDVFSFSDALDIINTEDSETIKQAFIGQRFVNHAFTSTAVASDAGFGGNIKYRIYAPEGTHGLYAEPQSAYGNTVGNENDPTLAKPRLYYPGIKRNADTIGYEAEIILQRGTEFQITDVRFDDNGHIEVDMQIVSQPLYFKSGYEQTTNGGIKDENG